MKDTPPTKKNSQESYINTGVRLPVALHTELRDAAERNGRSMNAEIIARLQAEPVYVALADIKRQSTAMKAMMREILDLVRK